MQGIAKAKLKVIEDRSEYSSNSPTAEWIGMTMRLVLYEIRYNYATFEFVAIFPFTQPDRGS